ncbi:hypothetical protein HMPREF9372_1405 [Sporosarcina newyorkensis 2681]|uniref:Uncharacterized protein n=1 Tax=Sporosarcina newyorkensis 2681 TaxID=1027292 RepID=F9DRH5_9BACL|nr:hypothetical protein HMPREF9372_1405 [Sporosarcina newyorkensis 2681]
MEFLVIGRLIDHLHLNQLRKIGLGFFVSHLIAFKRDFLYTDTRWAADKSLHIFCAVICLQSVNYRAT